MNEVKCPSCKKNIMSPKELERLFKNASGRTLLSHCSCGEALEIRSSAENVFHVTAASGKRMEEDKDRKEKMS